MSNVVKHKFVSAKTDSSDSSLVRPSNWNDEHKFAGGNDGEYLMRQSAETDGAAWTPLKAASYAKASLPSAGTAGRLARVSDDVGGLWMDNGSSWVQLATTFNAAEQSGSDACEKIQAAINKASTAGGGMVDARGLTGSQSGAGFTIKQDVGVQLGEIDLTLTASIIMEDNTRLIGVRGSQQATYESSPGTFKGGTRLLANWTTGTGAARAIIQYGNSNTTIREANVLISDLYLYGDDKALYGIWASRFASIWLYRIWVNKCTTDPFHIGDLADPGGDYSFIAHLEDCYALGASLGANFKITNANQVRMTRCFCDSNIYSVDVTSTNSNISQCYFESPTTAHVYVSANSGSNLFENNTLIAGDSTDYGFYIDDSNDAQILKGNYIFGQNVASSIGILATANATKVIANGNRINNYPNGIKFQGTGHVAVGNSIKTSAAGTGLILDGSNHVAVGNEIATTSGTPISKLSGTGQVVIGNRVDAAPGSMFHNEIQDDLYIVGGTLRLDNNEAIYWKDSGGNWRRVAVLSSDNLSLGDADHYGADIFIDSGSTSKTIKLRLGTTDGVIIQEPSDGNTALSVRRNVSGSLSSQVVSMGAADSGGTGYKVLRVPN